MRLRPSSSITHRRLPVLEPSTEKAQQRRRRGGFGSGDEFASLTSWNVLRFSASACFAAVESSGQAFSKTAAAHEQPDSPREKGECDSLVTPARIRELWQDAAQRVGGGSI